MVPLTPLARRSRLAVGLATFGLALAACGSSNNTTGGGGSSGGKATGAPIYLGYNGELSGPSAAFGVPTLHGVELAISEINSAGGIDNRPVNLTVYDNGGDATKAVSLQSKIVGDSRNIAMLGLNFGADTKASATRSRPATR